MEEERNETVSQSHSAPLIPTDGRELELWVGFKMDPNADKIGGKDREFFSIENLQSNAKVGGIF